MLEIIFEQSIELTFWLQSLGDWLHPVMEFFTFLGNEEFYLLLMPVFIWVIDFRLGYKIGVMLLVTTGINGLAKLTFRMPRPYWIDPKVGSVSSPAGGFGLPSGHSQTPLSVFGLLCVVRLVGYCVHLPGGTLLHRRPGRLGPWRDCPLRLHQAGRSSKGLVQ